MTLISGPTDLDRVPFVETVDVVSAQDMFEAVSARAEESDLIFKAAAVADYTPCDYSGDKIKKKEGDLSIPLKRTTDILAWLGSTAARDRSSAAFPWRHGTWWPTARPSWKRKRWT